jgi:DNA invertase Pin-like site-specific DNA recombinase
VLVHVYEDEALSRAEYVKRPELFAMLNAASRRELDVIVLRDLDRLGGDTNRNGVILSDLNDSGVSVHEYKPGAGLVQLDGAIGKLMAVVKSFAAEIEREKTAQRTHEALSSKATKGHAVGGVRYGHKNVPIIEGGKKVRTDLAIDEQQAPIVLEIWRRHWVDGDGYRTIALDLNARGVASPRAGKRGLGAWSHRLIFEISHNFAYLGQITYGVHKKTYRLGTKIRVRREASEVQVMEMPHLRIIPPEIERAMRRHVSKKKNSSSSSSSLTGVGKKPAHLLSGIARCATCGGPMQARLAKGNRIYYCGRRNDCGPTVCANDLRRSLDEADRSVVGWISRNVLDEDVVQAIFKQVQKRIRERSKATASEIPRIEKELVKLQGEARKLAQAIAMTGGKVDALATTIHEKQDRIRALEARLALLKSAPNVLAMEATRLEKRHEPGSPISTRPFTGTSPKAGASSAPSCPRG